MARRTICLVPAGWGDDTIARRDCRRRDHRHITTLAAREMEAVGAGEWVPQSGSGSAMRIKAVRPGARLSLVLGEWLATMVYRNDPVGRAIYAEIRRK